MFSVITAIYYDVELLDTKIIHGDIHHHNVET